VPVVWMCWTDFGEFFFGLIFEIAPSVKSRKTLPVHGTHTLKVIEISTERNANRVHLLAHFGNSPCRRRRTGLSSSAKESATPHRLRMNSCLACFVTPAPAAQLRRRRRGDEGVAGGGCLARARWSPRNGLSRDRGPQLPFSGGAEWILHPKP
jgi:hypothetical protein